jgi:hypothetical protein
VVETHSPGSRVNPFEKLRCLVLRLEAVNERLIGENLSDTIRRAVIITAAEIGIVFLHELLKQLVAHACAAAGLFRQLGEKRLGFVNGHFGVHRASLSGLRTLFGFLKRVDGLDPFLGRSTARLVSVRLALGFGAVNIGLIGNSSSFGLQLAVNSLSASSAGPTLSASPMATASSAE